MRQLILIGFAGFLGTVARFGLSEFVAERSGGSFPWGTLGVNLIGCFLAGFLFCFWFTDFYASKEQPGRLSPFQPTSIERGWISNGVGRLLNRQTRMGLSPTEGHLLP